MYVFLCFLWYLIQEPISKDFYLSIRKHCFYWFTFRLLAVVVTSRSCWCLELSFQSLLKELAIIIKNHLILFSGTFIYNAVFCLRALELH